MKITHEIIESLKSKRGGWTRESLARLGVPWPPQKGWKDRILGKEMGEYKDQPELRGIDNLMEFTPKKGDDNPMRMVNGEWFNSECKLESECLSRGRHRWGKDKYADEHGIQGYHHCLDCFRCEPL